jgi:hypothetical protein
MKTLFTLTLSLLFTTSSYACRDHHLTKFNPIHKSPLIFDENMTLFFFGETLEYQVMQVLTGQERSPAGDLITQRGAINFRRQTWKYLEDQLVSLGFESKAHEYNTQGTNIWTILPATISSNEYVVLGAHFDSVGNAGANDNASGVAAVMAVANKLKDVSYRNKNVIFVFLDEEEKGLIGARHFAQFLKDNSYRVHSVHTIDQIAWDQDGDRAIELEKAPDDLVAIYQKVKIDSGYSMTLHKSSVTSTDHQAFRSLGFKSMGLTEEYVNGDTTPCYHSACDQFNTVNFDYLTNTANFWADVISYILTI